MAVTQPGSSTALRTSSGVGSMPSLAASLSSTNPSFESNKGLIRIFEADLKPATRHAVSSGYRENTFAIEPSPYIAGFSCSSSPSTSHPICVAVPSAIALRILVSEVRIEMLDGMSGVVKRSWCFMRRRSTWKTRTIAYVVFLPSMR